MMKEKQELDKYDIGIIMNALIDMRNSLKEQNRDCTPVEDVMIKIFNMSENRKITYKIVEDR